MGESVVDDDRVGLYLCSLYAVEKIPGFVGRK